MTEAVAHLLASADQLSAAERVELADRLVERLTDALPPDLVAAQAAEVRRRIAQVDSGEATLVPAEVVIAEARQLVGVATGAR